MNKLLAVCMLCISNMSAVEFVEMKLQKMDLAFSPVEEPCQVVLQAQKNGDQVTLLIPPMHQDFLSQTGGYIDTIGNRLPRKFRPTGGLPVSFYVAGAGGEDDHYVGYIDRHGRLQFSGENNSPINEGLFITYPTSISFLISPKPQVTLNNFPIAPGLSDAAKWNHVEFADDNHQQASIAFDFGDYDDMKNGFRNSTLYATWADNSSELAFNTVNQPFKSYALARIDVWQDGAVHKISVPKNLSREIGGEVLPIDYTYAQGSVAIDPTNEDCVVVAYQQRKDSRIGFVLSRSFDGGTTWTKKIVGIEDPAGGQDLHVGFDRFGGLWLNYIAANYPTDSDYGVCNYLLYSQDRGETFTVILKQMASDAGIVPSYRGVAHSSLGIGPDAGNRAYDTVWLGVSDVINDHKTSLNLHVWGIRVRGRGVHNIDYDQETYGPLKKYVVPSGEMAGFSVLDVMPDGTVVIGVTQTQTPNTAIDMKANNSKLWINILQDGLEGKGFSKRREIALTAGGSSLTLDPSPHHAAALEQNLKLAVDKSNAHRGRIYCAFLDRGDMFTGFAKPYLTWSDDKGLSWSPPIRVHDDEATRTDLLHALAVDPITGIVAMTWADARESVDNTKVRRYGLFLRPDQLASRF